MRNKDIAHLIVQSFFRDKPARKQIDKYEGLEKTYYASLTKLLRSLQESS